MMQSDNRGRIKRGMGTLIGNAGEHFVVAELLRRYVIADLAPRNAPWVDVLATNERTTVRIRVKTKTDAAMDWTWQAKADGTIFRTVQPGADVTVLVDLRAANSQPVYFVIPTVKLDERLRVLHKRWEDEKATRSRSSKMRRVGKSQDDRIWLEQFKNNWDLIAASVAINDEQ